MKQLSITFLVLIFLAAPSFAQQIPKNTPPVDRAVYQLNAPTAPEVATPTLSTEGGTAPLMVPQEPPAPKTATEQGYKGNYGAPLSAWDMQTLRSRESPRQRGERIEVASRKNGVATDASSHHWFASWEMRLVSVGVHPDKVRFEGRRLTKDQFAIWASRQIWAVEAGLIAP